MVENESQKLAEEQPAEPEVEAFSFGDPETVLNDRIIDGLGVWLLDNGSYYSPPVSLTGLAKLLKANAYHGPILEFKTNMVMRGFQGNSVVKRRDMKKATTDYNVFANCYFKAYRTIYGDIVRLQHLPAINMRRCKGQGCYGMLNNTGKLIEFKPGEVIHIANYDVNQTIYGVPGYLGAIQSMLLNEDATLFRRKYYKNGAHIGYIFYSTAAGLDEKTRKKMKAAIEKSKGIGNFKNMFLHIGGADKDAVQIKPVGDFSTKDDLEKIKNISRDDIIAANRMPPALAAIMPGQNTSFGDLEKVDAVYQRNEVTPIREDLLEINDYLPVAARVSFDTPANTSV